MNIKKEREEKNQDIINPLPTLPTVSSDLIIHQDENAVRQSFVTQSDCVLFDFLKVRQKLKVFPPTVPILHDRQPCFLYRLFQDITDMRLLRTNIENRFADKHSPIDLIRMRIAYTTLSQRNNLDIGQPNDK